MQPDIRGKVIMIAGVGREPGRAPAPGLTQAPGRRASVDEPGIAQLTGRSLDGRLVPPEDVVPLAIFPCTDAANPLPGALPPIRPVTG